MNPMIEKLAGLWPEITLLSAACICMLLGLAPSAATRRLTAWITGLALALAAYLVVRTNGELAGLTVYVKLAVCFVGLILLLLAAAVPDQLELSRHAESGREKFDPANVMRGEFYAFFLLSLTGVMLCAGASDLVWLFLALELTSLPTYVMVATARDRIEAQEAGVKYFFLGAMAAAIFLYGFTLIYGATGQTEFAAIRAAVTSGGGHMSPLLLTGLVLAIVGIAFKIAAVPMHFYVADVYQGATTPVTAFLAFVPKTAGFVSIILLLSLVPQPLPPVISWLLWGMAAATMTVGNVLGLLQTNVKRVLAYSSIAHTGYMLVGLLALTPFSDDALGNGTAAVLFYLIAYGLATIGAFAVLGSLQTAGQEAQEYDDIAGLARRHPALAGIMLVCVLSLIGLPPMVGFLGKIYLFGSAIAHSGGHPEYIWLVVLAVLNSAVSAVYYLRIAAACFFGETAPQTSALPGTARPLGAAIAAVAAITLGVAGGSIVNAARNATLSGATTRAVSQPPAENAPASDPTAG